MRIVVDTNIVISGIFFGGNPRKIVEAIADGGIDAYATIAIMDEYMGILKGTRYLNLRPKLSPGTYAPGDLNKNVMGSDPMNKSLQ